MKSDASVLTIIEVINRLALPYMVTGSLASNTYGIERATKDADFVLQSAEDSISRLSKALEPPLQMDPQATFETITGTTRFIIRAGKSFKIEIFILSDDPHDQERFRRRKKGMVENQPVWLPTAEDVIITKLRWSKQGKRTKDTDDVRNVIAVQDNLLDWDYIHRWCDQHGTRDLLEQIRRDLPGR